MVDVAVELHINKILSPRMHVTPLKDGEFAKYRLVMADRDDVTRTEESTGKKMKHQQVYSFIGHKRVYDPFSKKKVLIQNIVNFKHEKLPSGEIKEIPIEGRLLFPNSGEIIVTHRDQDQYAFMERMDENGSNEFRNPNNTKPVFYRVDVKKQAMKELEVDYIKVDALLWVRDANETEINTIYRGLDAELKKKINADAGFEQMKRGIFLIAQEFPIVVLKASTNKEAKLKVQIMDAERFKIMFFSEGGANEPRQWLYLEGKPQTICEIKPGEHKIDGLIKFFLGSPEGRNWYVKMTEGLKTVFESHRR